jgi:hypothetical protein
MPRGLKRPEPAVRELGRCHEKLSLAVQTMCARGVFVTGWEDGARSIALQIIKEKLGNAPG